MNISFESDLNYSIADYEHVRKNPNRFSNWYPRLRYIMEEIGGFEVPKTKIIPINFNLWIALIENEEVDSQLALIYEKELKDFMDNKRGLLMLGHLGAISLIDQNFIFEKETFVEKLKSLYNAYSHFRGLPSAEIAIQDFPIDLSKYPKVNSGVLIPQTKVYYNFDKKKVIGSINEWDERLTRARLSAPDYAANIDAIVDTEKTYSENIEKLITKVDTTLIDFRLMSGNWELNFINHEVKTYFIQAKKMVNDMYARHMDRI